MTIEYRELNTVPELDRTIDVQMAAWGRDDRSAIAVHMLQAVIHAGGSVIGALKDGDVIGYALSIVAKRDALVYLWSHQTAVFPQYQRHQIGFGLKLAQREWALAHGYSVIGWTYDPLQHKNARFNLHKLGAIGETYIPNFYGDSLQDDLNRGMPSDRVEVMWYLDSPRVSAIAQGTPPTPQTTEYPPSHFALYSDESGEPHLANILPTSEFCFIEIPYDINTMKKNDKPRAMRWQRLVSESMQKAFAEGFLATDCIEQNGRYWVMLHKINSSKNG